MDPRHEPAPPGGDAGSRRRPATAPRHWRPGPSSVFDVLVAGAPRPPRRAPGVAWRERARRDSVARLADRRRVARWSPSRCTRRAPPNDLQPLRPGAAAVAQSMLERGDPARANGRAGALLIRQRRGELSCCRRRSRWPPCRNRRRRGAGAQTERRGAADLGRDPSPDGPAWRAPGQVWTPLGCCVARVARRSRGELAAGDPRWRDRSVRCAAQWAGARRRPGRLHRGPVATPGCARWRRGVAPCRRGEPARRRSAGRGLAAQERAGTDFAAHAPSRVRATGRSALAQAVDDAHPGRAPGGG